MHDRSISHTDFRTQSPLVVFGATGLLGSQLVFMACMDRFSPHLILHGSHLPRLEGLMAEIVEAGFPDIQITITTDTEEACRHGGYFFYSRSVQSGKQTREEMLLDNMPAAKETGLALKGVKDSVKRVVCVSNPSDIIGLALLVHSGLEVEKVCSISALDTSRYRRALRDVLRVRDEDLSGVYTLGSHDMSMAVMRDTVLIGGKSIDQHIEDGLMTEENWEDIRHRVINGGRMIIKRRGHTAYQSPAYLGYRMLIATDDAPFTYPSSCYHNSTLFPHCFMSLPTCIDDGGCHHLPLSYSSRDVEALSNSYKSISLLRDIAIEHGYLSPLDMWEDRLQIKTDGLIL
ncbi:hypothetical protein [Porphyromonas sp.]|uniref:hypothetical protein n=1 Tax=Porphyromonas sp. TaxID=1924944 RepID=UPI0026DA8848|nr:hypothetical protein [Porphyromonas sp.]MDO4695260.1 hypothetical protein [Porphyromonas sp.]MDO4771051.1 hypothetical protein [Porphyromonas sp.]